MKKLYVITRSDLGLVYSGVQAGHALAQWLLDNPNQEWNNHTLVYLSVENEYELKKVLMKAIYRGIHPSVFNEPDVENELTAIACYSDGKAFKNLKLYGTV
jgi:hypothetical protein